MKIFHVITLAELGGAQSVVVNLANKAVEDGHEVYVISSVVGKMWALLNERVRHIKIISLQRSISPQKDFKVFKELRKYYKLYKPDVIQLHSSKIGILGRLAFPKSKIIYTVHGFDSIRVAFRKFLPIEKALKNKCRFIASVSRYDTKNLNNEGIYSNVVTMYNGIKDWPKDESNLIPNNCVTEQLLQYVSDGIFIVMSISRISKPKRFDLFCDVAAQFLDNKKIRFIWIGNNFRPQYLPENVVCLGELVDAHQYLKYANLFALFSNYEGLPMSIIEALSYGKPVIASNVGGISEILDGKNGFAVENKVEQIVEMIKEFNGAMLDYAKFSSAARYTYEDKFTIEKMYDGYNALYKKIKIESIN